MKKLSLVLALIFVLTCALVACGGESDESSAASSAVESSSTSKGNTSKGESSTADDSSEESQAPVEEPKDAIEVTGEVISIGCEYEVPGGKGVIISEGEWPCSYNASLTDGVANPELAYDNTWFGFNDKPDDDGEANMFEGVGTVIIDLGEAKNVTGVKANIFTGGQDGIAPIGSIVVTVSTDGVTFTNPVKLNVPTGTSVVGLAEGGFEAVSAQYVKVVFTKGGDGAFMFLNEIEVYGA